MKSRLTRIAAGAFAALLTVALATVASPATAATTPDGLFEYSVSGTDATITGYNAGAPPETEVTIPSTIDDGGSSYTVVAIGDYAFEYEGITSLTIPDTVTTIGTFAFHQNALTSLVIPASVTTIGEVAFGENALSTVAFSDGLVTIGEAAFETNQLTTVVIPDTVTTIGNSAFVSNNITTVFFGEGVTNVGHFAFIHNPIESVVFSGNAPSFTGYCALRETLAAGYGYCPPATTPGAPIVFHFHDATGFPDPVTDPWTGDEYATKVINAKWSTLTLDPGTPVLADGSSSYTATLTVVDGGPAGNPVEGFPARFTIPAQLNASASTCVTDSAGTCTITLTSTTAGTFTIGALAGAAPDDLRADATFDAVPTPDPVPTLADTGFEIGPAPLALGAAILALGIILLVLARLRRKNDN